MYVCMERLVRDREARGERERIYNSNTYSLGIFRQGVRCTA